MYSEAEAELRSLGKLRGHSGDAEALLARGMADPAQRATAVDSLETSPDNGDIRRDPIGSAFSTRTLSDNAAVPWTSWKSMRSSPTALSQPGSGIAVSIRCVTIALQSGPCETSVALHAARRHEAMNERHSFFAELKRRNVYKVAIAYAVVGWLLIQVATQVFPFFEIPNWAVRLVVLAIVIGFPIALVIAWAFELTPEGLKRTEDVDPATQGQRKPHVWIYVVIIGARDFDWIDFYRSLHGTKYCQYGSHRSGDSFDHPAKIDCSVAIRKSQRRQSERLFRRRNSGRNPHPPLEDCRPEGDLPNLDSEVQERAGQPREIGSSSASPM